MTQEIPKIFDLANYFIKENNEVHTFLILMLEKIFLK